MDKKIKFLLIFLGIVTLAAVGLSAWIYFSAQDQVRQYTEKHAELESQNSYLQEKLDTTLAEARHWRTKSESVTASLNQLGREHTLLQQQYDSLLREKETLFAQNENLGAEIERLSRLYAQTQEKKEIDTSDNFLASLLEEKAELQVEVEKLKGKILARETQIEELEKRGQPTQERLAHLEREKKILENDLSDARKTSGLLSKDLLKETKERAALQEQLNKAEEQLKGISQERDRLAEQLTAMKQALEKRLAGLKRTKEVLEKAVQGADKAVKQSQSASIQLPPIVVKAEKQAAALPQTQMETRQEVMEQSAAEPAGRIITVNDTYKFVVIDIGREDGVKSGMSFDVYRRRKKIGRVEVIETRQNIAACDIKEVSVKRLKVSDIVRR